MKFKAYKCKHCIKVLGVFDGLKRPDTGQAIKPHK